MLSLPWLMFMFSPVLGGVFGWYLFSMAHRARRRRQAAEKEQHASDVARQIRRLDAINDKTRECGRRAESLHDSSLATWRA